MKLFLLIVFLSLIGCTHNPLTVSSDEKKPVLQFQTPAKQILAPVVWDFPRLATRVSIKNSRKCIDLAKANNLKPSAIYGSGVGISESCKVPAVDRGSNLYIGLTEANYRNLVNNYHIFMMREKRWVQLLDEINKIQAIGADK